MSLPPSDSSPFRPDSDQLSIVGLRYEAHHGWYEAERDSSKAKNIFEVDVVVRGSFRDVQDLSRGYTPERHVDTRVVDVHISRLRAKLEIDPSNPDLILTARGTGYLFQRIVVPNAST